MKTILALLILAVAGCQHAPRRINDPTSQLAGPIIAARAEIVAAKVAVKLKDFVAAVPHLDAALLSLTAEDAAIASVAKESIAYQTKLADDEAFIAKHRNDWLGPRTHRWFWGLLVTGLVLSLGFGALKIFVPGSPFIGIIYHGLLGIVSFGMSWAHAIGGWVAGRFHKTAATVN